MHDQSNIRLEEGKSEGSEPHIQLNMRLCTCFVMQAYVTIVMSLYLSHHPKCVYVVQNA